ncbi:MAG: nucleotidyltransferase family protein [Ferrovibrionaceae bacterium]
MDRDLEPALIGLVRGDAVMMAALMAVRDLGLPQGAIGAGFVRALVWDHLSGFATRSAVEDVDVLYHDPADIDPRRETEHEARLARMLPGLPWSVRNQARMHLRNDDAPYRDLDHALRHWLETPTCVALSLGADGCVTVIAPFGLADLFALVIRPTTRGRERRGAFDERIAVKGWLRRWPRARLVE